MLFLAPPSHLSATLPTLTQHAVTHAAVRRDADEYALMPHYAEIVQRSCARTTGPCSPSTFVCTALRKKLLEKAAETLANRRSTRASKGSGRRSSCGSACARPPWRRRWRRSRPSIPWRRSGRGRRGSCPGLRVPGIKNIQIFRISHEFEKLANLVPLILWYYISTTNIFFLFI